MLSHYFCGTSCKLYSDAFYHSNRDLWNRIPIQIISYKVQLIWHWKHVQLIFYWTMDAHLRTLVSQFSFELFLINGTTIRSISITLTLNLIKNWRFWHLRWIIVVQDNNCRSRVLAVLLHAGKKTTNNYTLVLFTKIPIQYWLWNSLTIFQRKFFFLNDRTFLISLQYDETEFFSLWLNLFRAGAKLNLYTDVVEM